MEIRFLKRNLSSDSLQSLLIEVRLAVQEPMWLGCRLCLVDEFGTRILCSDYREFGRVDQASFCLANVMLEVEAGFYALGLEFIPWSDTSPSGDVLPVLAGYTPFQNLGVANLCAETNRLLGRRNLAWCLQQEPSPQLRSDLGAWLPLSPLEVLDGYWFSDQRVTAHLIEGGLDEARAADFTRTVIAPWKPQCQIDFGAPSTMSENGRKTAEGIISNGKPGFLMFGPYVRLMKGRYCLLLNLESSEADVEVVVDVVCDRGQRHLLRPCAVILNEGCHEYSVEFKADFSTIDVEFRLLIVRPAQVSLRAACVLSREHGLAQHVQSLMQFGLMLGQGGSLHGAEVSSLFLAGLGRSPCSVELALWSGKQANELALWLMERTEHQEYTAKLGFVQEVRDTVAAISGETLDDSRMSDWSSLLDLGYSRAKKLLLKLALVGRAQLHLLGAAPSAGQRDIIFVFDQKKDRDSLRPVYDELVKQLPDSNIQMASLDDFLDDLAESPRANLLIAVAHEYIDRVLRLADIRAAYVYLEHGTAPLKRYTYSSHYSRYDFCLLPGNIWVDRLGQIYPETLGRCFVVGYPKLRASSFLYKTRKKYCLKFGLDATQPIVLFAPTWGADLDGNNKGINNIRHLKDIPNLLAIPHEGDQEVAEQLRKEYPAIHVLEAEESISDHYAHADVLISDASSTAVEFARLGKRVVCVDLGDIPDYESRFMSPQGIPMVPYTDYAWDFAPYVRPDNLAATVMAELSKVEKKKGESVFPVVEQMCSCFGAEAAGIAASIISRISMENK